MARALYVGTLNKEIKSELTELTKKAPGEIAKRAQIILSSTEGYTVSEIVQIVNLHANNVRKWIRRFIEKGIPGLQHGGKGKSRNVIFDGPIRAKIIKIANSRPRDLGEHYTTWSLYKLRRYLIRRKVVKTISIERLRHILISGKLRFGRSREWLHSKDPDYEAKKNRIFSLYENKPKDGVVVCFDEKGTVAVKDYQGSAWSKKERRVLAKQTVRGTTELFAAYSPHEDELTVKFYKKNEP